MREITRLKGKVFTEQLNVWVDAEMKCRFRKLKEEKRVNIAEEIRKTLADLADQLERATA